MIGIYRNLNEMEQHNKINSVGYNETPIFGPSKNNLPIKETLISPKIEDQHEPYFKTETERNKVLFMLLAKLKDDGDTDSIELIRTFIKDEHPSIKMTFKIMTSSSETKGITYNPEMGGIVLNVTGIIGPSEIPNND